MTNERRKEINALRLALLSGKGRFRQKVAAVLSDLEGHGFRPLIASGLRSASDQAEKKAKGYSKTLNSPHLHGLAADIVDCRWMWPELPETPQQTDFRLKLISSGEAHDLKSGKGWKSYGVRGDYAHLQAKDWKRLT